MPDPITLSDVILRIHAGSVSFYLSSSFFITLSISSILLINTATKLLFALFQIPMKSLQDHRFIPKTSPFLQISTICLPNSLPKRISIPKIPSPPMNSPHCSQIPTQKLPPFFNSPTTHLSSRLKIQVSVQKMASFFNFPPTRKPQLPFAFMALLSLPLPADAAEEVQVSDKINIEYVLTSIDDFFNRYPFFVAGCAFIWLVVIPLTEEYLKKYKFIPCIDAFRKLRDEPNSQLLDIRKEQSVQYLGSPNLKILNKNVVRVEFAEGEEDKFLKEVLKRFEDPGNTVICVLDNFDGNSLKVAELLFKNGFKAAYAIKGGLRGKAGWQAIQENLLPPSVHVYPRKKSKSSVKFEKINQGTDNLNSSNGKTPTSSSINQEENQNIKYGHTNTVDTDPEAKLANRRPLSPYPKYPDLKPPSSPTPSKPQS